MRHTRPAPVLRREIPPWAGALKQGTDRTLAALGLLALLPLLCLIALLVKASSPGPVLYKSRRIGRHYQPFDMYKFRTMRQDADRFRDTLRQQANLTGTLFKLENDPRVTSVGRVLRAFSLDEFPQLLNVLRGEMSLVGPRPLPPDESALFKPPYDARFAVLPGVTGLWQISGRSTLDFQDLCELELSYLSRWSLVLDVQILLKTIPAVLQSRGAY